MPYFKTAQEWLDQSKLLLEARPATTRVETRYTIKAVKPRKTTDGSPSELDTDAAAKPPRGSLVFRTYDDASGVVLKYRTTKAAEVSRLVYSSLGSLGRGMAAVPEPPADQAMPDAPPPVEEKNAHAAGPAAPQGGQQQQSGGGGKKKKKGKK